MFSTDTRRAAAGYSLGDAAVKSGLNKMKKQDHVRKAQWNSSKSA